MSERRSHTFFNRFKKQANDAHSDSMQNDSTQGGSAHSQSARRKSGAKGKWKAPAMYTAVGMLAGSTLVSAPALASSGMLKAFTGELYQNGQFVQKTPGFVYDGTSYFGVWYLQHLLRQDGVQSSWNGTSLQIQNAPVLQASSVTASTTTGQQLSSAADTITVNGVTYVPLSTVQQLLSQLSGDVHVEASGNGTPSLSAAIEELKGAIRDIYAYSSKTLAATSGLSGDQKGQYGQNFDGAIKTYADANSSGSGGTVTLSSMLGSSNTQGEDLPGPAEAPGLNQAAFEALLHAGQRLQTAVQDLTAIESALNGATTGSTTSTTSGTTTSGTTTSGTTTGSTTTTTSGSTTSGSTTSTSTELATLQTVTTALQTDWTTLNSMELAVETSLGMTSGTTTSGTTTSGTTSSGTTTSGTTTSTTTTSGTTTSPTTAADPTAIAALLSDLQTQLQSLQQLQGTTGEQSSQGDH